MSCLSKLSWPDRSYFYSIMVVSLLTAKFLHLFSHFSALPLLLFLLYLPTFLLLDIIVILGGRLFFRWSRVGGISLACLITSSAAAQIGFFIETGGELRWALMPRILRDLSGWFGLLMSGLLGLMLTIGLLGGIAWLFNPGIYNVTWRYLRWVEEEEGLVSSSSSVSEKNDRGCSSVGLTWGRVYLLAFVITEIILLAVRPSSPYTHMSGTLPFTIFEGLWTTRSEFCEPIPWDEGAVLFPYPELISQDMWTADTPDGLRGWRPGNPTEAPRQRPAWMPEKPMTGFGKFYRKREHHRREPHGRSYQTEEHGDRPILEVPHGHSRPHGYDPAGDPLKISNMNQPLLPQLEKILKEIKVPIRNILFFSLESTRTDIFPLMKDGTLYSQIMESRGGKSTPQNKKRHGPETDGWGDLSELSKVSEIITGQDAGFGPREPFANLTSGGINFKQAVTESTFTLKSLVASHCGANPLAVDFLEELEVEIYQPCLPQIMDLFNEQTTNLTKPESGDDHDWLWLYNSTWKSVFMQGATGKFDRMSPFIDYIGFRNNMHREEIADPNAKYPPKTPPLNYFGYSEHELKPYIRDLFLNAKENNERVFLSHITTTTHHPWATPPEYGPQLPYWGGKHAGKSAWNAYLNSINSADKWVMELLQVLKEIGAEQETLVVFLGDHGFGFGEDTMAKTTYANPHITNFWVPMVLRHPLLNFEGEENGMIQINATVSSMSIVPTILDLLVTTGSLPKALHAPAKFLQNEFEGQSLIRTLVPDVPVSYTNDRGQAVNTTRSSFSFGVINPGGTHFSVISQSPGTPYRLVLPVCEHAPYRFSDLSKDHYEVEVFESWQKGRALRKAVEKKYGKEAGDWVTQAEKIAGWSLWEGRRRWGYDGGTRREDRGAEHNDDGKLIKDHWWET
ncbi:alkaline-phosphatase-like protein [Tirmania nivea]|nr:alkaline-phosphatase-like protein [Tirmania nivea]